jgi:mono/diheme cytochrome c family protein
MTRLALLIVAVALAVGLVAGGDAPGDRALAASAPAGNLAHGKSLFAANCSSCHGATGRGGLGPSLIGEKSRKDLAAAVAWIKKPLPPMPKLYPAPLGEKDVLDIATYVETL